MEYLSGGFAYLVSIPFSAGQRLKVERVNYHPHLSIHPVSIPFSAGQRLKEYIFQWFTIIEIRV